MLRKMNAVDSFRKALTELPRGELARISRETGIDIGRLTGMRGPRKTDVRISTFALIAKAMGRPADELLGLETPPPSKAYEAVQRAAERDSERLARQLAKVQADIAKIQPRPNVSRSSKPRE